MKKQLLLIILSGALLTFLIFQFIALKNQESNSTHDEQLSDFAIEDTTSITKIVISDPDGNEAVLTKNAQDDWTLNGKHKARIDAMRIILKTAKLVSVKSEVPNAAVKNVLKTMAVTYKKIDYYSGNTLLKTWYVGSPTRDHYGTYMLLEKPGHGKSIVPFVMEIKGFFGHLASRFFIDEKEWRDKIIYSLQPEEISSVDFINNENPEYSFKIEVKGRNKFALYDGKHQPVNGFDTVNVRSYLLNFRKIAFEAFNRGILTPQQEDSLKKALPFSVITVTDKAGNPITLKAYRKEPTAQQKNLDGENYQFDVERLYAVIPSGEVVVMQYGTYDKIWRALLSFVR